MKQRGFTIVELIIVIVVIAILASLTVIAYRSVQRGAVLSKTIADLSAINDGVKIYQAKKGSYPISPGSTWIYSCNNFAGFSGVVGEYIDTVPQAPCTAGSSTNDSWVYRSNGTDYKLIHVNPSTAAVKDQVPAELRDTRYAASGTWGFWSSGASGW